MKKILLAWFFGLLGFNAIAQRGDKVFFSFRADSVAANKFDLHVTATLQDGWHIYAQEQPPEAVAQPTVITIAKNPMLVVSPGKWKELGTKETYTDQAAGIQQYQYGHSVDFVQTVTRKGKIKTVATGSITYQVCNEERCLPPKTIPFQFQLP